MSVAQKTRLIAERWSEDDVDSQYPAYYFNFEKPTHSEGNDAGNADRLMLRNKCDPLLHLPCRILDDWYLRLKPQRSLPYFTIEHKVFPHRRVPLPVDTLDLDKYIMGGTLKPQISGQEPIRIELEDMDFYTIDTSKGFRGYWVVTSQARYWLQNPCSKVLEIPKMRIKVEGENVLAWDDDRDAFDRGCLKAQLPSQEQLHQFHGAQLATFCAVHDLLIRSDGTYNPFIHKLSLTQLNKILVLRQEAKMRAKATTIQTSARQNLDKGSKFLVPHLRIVDPHVGHSRWFQELVARCEENQGMDIDPNQSKVSEAHRMESANSAEVGVEMDTKCETSSASESCQSGGDDENPGFDNLLPNSPLAPLKLTVKKSLLAFLSRPQKTGYKHPSVQNLDVASTGATTTDIADTSLKVTTDAESQILRSHVAAPPETIEQVKSFDTVSLSLAPPHPVIRGTEGPQQSSSSHQFFGDDRQGAIRTLSNPSRRSPLLTRKPRESLSPCNHPSSNTVQAGPLVSPDIVDSMAHAVVAPLDKNATDSETTFSTANTILPTIPKKPRMTDEHPQSKTSALSTGYALDRQLHNTGFRATVPATPSIYAEERQPKEISRAGVPLKFQDSSNSNPPPWKRQKISPPEFGQNFRHAFETPNSRGTYRAPAVQRYQEVQHPGGRGQHPFSSGVPFRGPTPMRQNTSSMHPGRMIHPLSSECYMHPVHPGSIYQGDRSQVPRRPAYATNNRFDDRKYEYDYHQRPPPPQSKHVMHPALRYPRDFQNGRDRSPGPSGNDNKTTG